MSFMIFQNQKTTFQTIKTTSPRSRKIDIFPKGLTHVFGPKMAIFSSFSFQAIRAKKMSFMILQIEKNPFQAIKTRSSKSPNIDIIPKGLTHGFWFKNGHFSNFFFQAIQARKLTFMVFQSEKTPLLTIKTNSSVSRKFDIIFSKRVTPWFWSKNGHFSNFFFQAIQARKMSFMIF